MTSSEVKSPLEILKNCYQWCYWWCHYDFTSGTQQDGILSYTIFSKIHAKSFLSQSYHHNLWIQIIEVLNSQSKLSIYTDNYNHFGKERKISKIWLKILLSYGKVVLYLFAEKQKSAKISLSEVFITKP